MSRRRVELLRTTSARLALLYAGLFGLSVAILFGLIYWAATTALGDRIDQDLAMERDALVARAGTAEQGVAAAVGDALRRSHGEFRYLVRDAGGTTLAGKLPAPPDWRSGYQEIELQANGDADREPHTFRALGQPLAGGGLLVVAQDAYALDELRELIVRAFGWGAAATLLLAAVGGGIMVWRVAHRIEVINRASERIMAGDLTERLPVGGGTRADEFDRLAANLNMMLERIEKLVEGLRQVSTDIAHDLRTPLARLRRGLEAARANAAQEPNPTHLAAIDSAVTQADDLLATFAGLLRIAQIESGATRFVFAPVDLSAVVSDVLEVYRPAAEEKCQILEGEIAASVYVAGDRILLTQMVANIAQNAIRHAPERTSVCIKLVPGADDGPLLTISDKGPGIPPGERANVFRRFYRLDRSRGSPGNGLGLSMVAAIAELHGVSIQLTENIPHGLKVTLAFPSAGTAVSWNGSPPSRKTPRTRAGNSHAPRPPEAVRWRRSLAGLVHQGREAGK
jgi:signal transduction histidine kinase